MHEVHPSILRISAYRLLTPLNKAEPFFYIIACAKLGQSLDYSVSFATAPYQIAIRTTQTHTRYSRQTTKKMGAAAWATPVGVLAGLAVAMFVFIWWWFPRHYRKGIQDDMDRVDEAKRQRELAVAEAEARGEHIDLEAQQPKQAPKAYIAPVTAY